MSNNSSSTDRIEKQVTLDAPRSRVWRALTDVKQFGAWFGVILSAPFTAGAEISGRITSKGYEHVVFQAWVESINPETFFSFRWHPNAIDMNVDYSNEPTTLVAFTLEEVAGGTRLTIVESGFDAIPVSRRMQAFTSNTGGWTGQLENLRVYLAGPASP